MGYTADAKGALTAQDTPTQTVADLQAGYDRIEQIGGLVKGTKSYRESLTASQVAPGWLFTETDTGSLYLRLSGGWRPLFGGRVDFTPSWVNFNPNGATTEAWYQVTGSTVEGFVRVPIVPGFTLNTNGIELVPPVTPSSALDGKPAGQAVYAKSGTGYWEGALLFGGSGNLRLVHTNNGGSGFLGGVTNSQPFGGWTPGDVIMLRFKYEV